MMYHILLLIAAVMFAVAFLLVGYRMLVGPNSCLLYTSDAADE